MNAVIILLATLIDIYIYIMIASIIFGWLVYFKVINTQSRFVYLVGDFLFRVTEPVLAPVRRFLPNLGAIDISPIIIFVALYFLRNLLVFDIAPALQ